MAQSLFTTQTPDGTFSDGAPGIVTATTLYSVVDGSITHVRFWAAAGFLSGTWTGAVWQVTSDDTGNAGAGTLLSTGTAQADVEITPDTWNTIELDTPVPVVAGTLYRVGLHTPQWYVASNNYWSGHDESNGDLRADARSATRHQGAFSISSSLVYPTNVGSSANYFIDVVFVPAGEDPADGTAALDLELAVAASGARASDGTAALGLDLAVSTSGARASQGSAPLGLDLAVAASGARSSVAQAALGLGLAVSAQGARGSAGAAALGLALTVSVTGSNGQSGRPVKPWPGTVTPVSSYPWTPRPVRSFQEVDHP